LWSEMGRVESSIEIEAPIEKVFAFLSNPKNQEKIFAHAEVKVENVSEQPIGVGTTYRTSAVLAGRKADFHSHGFVEFEENCRVVDQDKDGPLKKEELTFVFATTEGGTKVTMTIDYELPYSVLGKILDKLTYRKEFERFLNGGAQTAKEILEAAERLTPELKPQTQVIETLKAEPRHLTEEDIAQARALTKPSQIPVKETRDHGSKIIDIEGIGRVYAEKLNSVNIYTTSDLLEAGATPLGRKELAEKTGISGKLILEWVKRADLVRIKGVGEEYSDLLEATGVDTVVELAKRVPETLHAKMLEVNEQKNLVNRPPPLNAVKDWIEQAKKLPTKVEY
jgi:predicted flap endonuclease-1-like 5' DNA nuclease/carbon monoxide dehydrogenase subunit G